MSPEEDLRLAIEWYLEAIPPSRTSPPAPLSDPALVETAIEQLDAAIAPFHLPAEIEWLWRNWQPEAFSPLPYPRLTDPTRALELWEYVADPQFPEVLAPIAYESHGFLLVELGLPAEEPAPVWRYAYGDLSIVLAYPSLASLFRVCATAVEAAGVRPPAREEDRWATYGDLLGGAEFERLAERQLAASPQAGRDRQVTVQDLRTWPPAWHVAQGVTEASIRPLGATHTVQEFVEAAALGPVVGRIVGHLRIRGGSSWGSYGELSDGTGSMPVLKPRSVLDVGGRAREDEVEIQLTSSGPTVASDDLDPLSRAVRDAVSRGDLDMASALGAELTSGMEDLASHLPVVRRIVPLQ